MTIYVALISLALGLILGSGYTLYYVKDHYQIKYKGVN